MSTNIDYVNSLWQQLTPKLVSHSSIQSNNIFFRSTLSKKLYCNTLQNFSSNSIWKKKTSCAHAFCEASA